MAVPPPVFRVRPMTIADYQSVYALWRATPGVGLDESDEPGPTQRYLARNPGLSLVATDDRQRIAAAVLCGHDGRRGYLSHLAVAEPARGAGLGRRMVERCLDSLAGQGLQRCNVRVFSDNQPAADFWRRMGFTIRDDLSVMQRTLPRPITGGGS